MKMQIKSPKELVVYQKAYALAMEIFRISKNWPAEEKFSLIDQIRRSSRSACANLREAWLRSVGAIDVLGLWNKKSKS